VRARAAVDPGVAAAVLLLAAALSIDGLWRSFASPFVIQDDARHFVVFMRRWLGTGLFEHDVIADYFLSTLPLGFKAVYGAGALIGLDPVVVSKLLPVPLTLALGWFAVRLGRRLTGSAPGALAVGVVVLLLQATSSGTSSGVPRAFAPPLLVAGLLYILEDRRVALAVVIAALAAFYPQATILMLGIAGLSAFQGPDGSYRAAPSPQRVRTVVPAIGLGAAMLAAFALQVDAFGPAVPAGVARTYAVFQEGGRAEFFVADPALFYLCHDRAGLLPIEALCAAVAPAGPWAEAAAAGAVAAGLVLLVLGLARWWRGSSPARPDPAVSILLAVLLAGAALYGLAHPVLFALHLPSRYSHAAAGLAGQIGLGVLLGCLLTRALGRVRTWAGWHRAGGAAALVVAASLGALAWALPGYPYMALVEGRSLLLYEAVGALPPDGVVATLTDEGSFIAALASRSVVTAAELEVPYSLGYYERMRAQTERLIEAHFTGDAAVLERFVRDFGVAAFVVEDPWPGPEDLAHRRWLGEYRPALLRASAGAESVLRRAVPCGRPVGDGLVLVPAGCLKSPDP
jgi:hypothetical protein